MLLAFVRVPRLTTPAWLMLMLCLAAAFGTSRVRADAEQVVVVVESPFSEKVADALRKALAKQSGAPVVSLREAMAGPEAPRVVLTLTGELEGRVSVVYWDATGQVDALSSPVAEDQLVLIASTLASALLQKHAAPEAFREQQRAGHVACESFEQLLGEWRLHGLTFHGVSHRRTFAILEEDF